jgi:hypothetical protein
MCTLYTVIMLWVLVPTSGESFRSTTGVYSRPSQLFIIKIVYIRALSVCSLVSLVFGCYRPLYVFWILCAFFVPDPFFFLLEAAGLVVLGRN